MFEGTPEEYENLRLKEIRKENTEALNKILEVARDINEGFYGCGAMVKDLRESVKTISKHLNIKLEVEQE